MTLGEYIKKYRKEHDLSARAFASLCGFSPQYILNLEKGKNNEGNPLSPTMDAFTKIARATGISELDLFLMINEDVTLNSTFTGREILIVKKFRDLDEDGKIAVESALDGEKAAQTKIIPLFPAAAGYGEPPSQDGFEEYVVPADSKAQFAVRISGDSMEPYLHDGEIVPCQRRRAEQGEIAVIMIAGFLLVKQYITDGENIYLRSTNRERKNLDYDIWASGDERPVGYGTVIFRKIPLVKQ